MHFRLWRAMASVAISPVLGVDDSPEPNTSPSNAICDISALSESARRAVVQDDIAVENDDDAPEELGLAAALADGEDGETGAVADMHSNFVPFTASITPVPLVNGINAGANVLSNKANPHAASHDLAAGAAQQDSPPPVIFPLLVPPSPRLSSAGPLLGRRRAGTGSEAQFLLGRASPTLVGFGSGGGGGGGNCGNGSSSGGRLRPGTESPSSSRVCSIVPSPRRARGGLQPPTLPAVGSCMILQIGGSGSPQGWPPSPPPTSPPALLQHLLTIQLQTLQTLQAQAAVQQHAAAMAAAQQAQQQQLWLHAAAAAVAAAQQAAAAVTPKQSSPPRDPTPSATADDSNSAPATPSRGDSNSAYDAPTAPHSVLRELRGIGGGGGLAPLPLSVVTPSTRSGTSAAFRSARLTGAALSLCSSTDSGGGSKRSFGLSAVTTGGRCEKKPRMRRQSDGDLLCGSTAAAAAAAATAAAANTADIDAAFILTPQHVRHCLGVGMLHSSVGFTPSSRSAAAVHGALLRSGSFPRSGGCGRGATDGAEAAHALSATATAGLVSGALAPALVPASASTAPAAVARTLDDDLAEAHAPLPPLPAPEPPAPPTFLADYACVMAATAASAPADPQALARLTRYMAAMQQAAAAQAHVAAQAQAMQAAAAQAVADAAAANFFAAGASLGQLPQAHLMAPLFSGSGWQHPSSPEFQSIAASTQPAPREQLQAQYQAARVRLPMLPPPQATAEPLGSPRSRAGTVASPDTVGLLPRSLQPSPASGSTQWHTLPIGARESPGLDDGRFSPAPAHSIAPVHLPVHVPMSAPDPANFHALPPAPVHVASAEAVPALSPPSSLQSPDYVRRSGRPPAVARAPVARRALAPLPPAKLVAAPTTGVSTPEAAATQQTAPVAQVPRTLRRSSPSSASFPSSAALSAYAAMTDRRPGAAGLSVLQALIGPLASLDELALSALASGSTAATSALAPVTELARHELWSAALRAEEDGGGAASPAPALSAGRRIPAVRAAARLVTLFSAEPGALKRAVDVLARDGDALFHLLLLQRALPGLRLAGGTASALDMLSTRADFEQCVRGALDTAFPAEAALAALSALPAGVTRLPALPSGPKFAAVVVSAAEAIAAAYGFEPSRVPTFGADESVPAPANLAHDTLLRLRASASAGASSAEAHAVRLLGHDCLARWLGHAHSATVAWLSEWISSLPAGASVGAFAGVSDSGEVDCYNGVVPRMASVSWMVLPREATVATAALVSALARKRLAAALLSLSPVHDRAGLSSLASSESLVPIAAWNLHALCAAFVASGGGGSSLDDKTGVTALLCHIVGGDPAIVRVYSSTSKSDGDIGVSTAAASAAQQRWLEHVARASPAILFDDVAGELALPLDLFAPSEPASVSLPSSAPVAAATAAALAHSRLLSAQWSLLIIAAAVRVSCRPAPPAAARARADAQRQVLCLLSRATEAYESQARAALGAAMSEVTSAAATMASSASVAAGSSGSDGAGAGGRSRLFVLTRLLAQAQEARAAAADAAGVAAASPFVAREAAAVASSLAALTHDSATALATAAASTPPGSKARALALTEVARFALVAAATDCRLGYSESSDILDVAASAILCILGDSSPESACLEGFAERARSCLERIASESAAFSVAPSELGGAAFALAASRFGDDRNHLAVSICAALLAEADAGTAAGEATLATSLALAPTLWTRYRGYLSLARLVRARPALAARFSATAALPPVEAAAAATAHLPSVAASGVVAAMAATAAAAASERETSAAAAADNAAARILLRGLAASRWRSGDLYCELGAFLAAVGEREAAAVATSVALRLTAQNADAWLLQARLHTGGDGSVYGSGVCSDARLLGALRAAARLRCHGDLVSLHAAAALPAAGGDCAPGAMLATARLTASRTRVPTRGPLRLAAVLYHASHVAF